MQENGEGRIYVAASWVHSLGKSDAVVLHAGWNEDEKVYNKEHVPGAVFIDTDLIEEPEDWNVRTPQEIDMVLCEYGLSKDRLVIIYGDGTAAERVALVFMWAGLTQVKIMDGGLLEWKRLGYLTEKKPHYPHSVHSTGISKIPTHPEYIITAPAEIRSIMANDPSLQLVSIRSIDEYNGKISGYPFIERKGEPLGAIWGGDYKDYLTPEGKVKPFNEILQDWKTKGIDSSKPMVFYCGTGWRACLPLLLCMENGLKDAQRLYDGGWYVWQKDPSNPINPQQPCSN